MNKQSTFILFVLFIFTLFRVMGAANSLVQCEESDFIASFINNYGFTLNARDTHEYHSFILGKTRTSFNELEAHLAQQEFDLKGRMVICGYQEDAIRSYYTHFNRANIDDEASIKTKSGWQYAHGNLFGFASGFVLKDVSDIGCNNNSCTSIFEHIAADTIGLFDDRAQIYHKHAFGQGYEVLQYIKQLINKSVLKNDPRTTIKLLQELWKYLYTTGICDGSKTIIATQDILFSIHYARYLLDSQLPLLKFFVGPDITYPIEVLRCQKSDATKPAQQFVQTFSERLVPIDNQPTAYVFCSFVDGVGKSTLLGNIKNYVEHGDDFSSYERVDNSSSQRATVWQMKENVSIVDLPAQASHFISKPDGQVFVDIDTVKSIDNAQKAHIVDYVTHNHAQLEKKFAQMLLDIQRQKNDIFLMSHDNPAMAYAKNIEILGITNIHWIPFEFESKFYLFDKSNLAQIRILQSFEGVHSFGLKVAQPEQMIFNKGISLPLRKDLFLKDLSDQMKARGIKRVVFVDFISMYPRTSRENIRVNFLLQQLKHIFKESFSINQSLYKGFMQPQELFWLLKKHKQDVLRVLVQETGVRFALYHLLQTNMQDQITCLDSHQITPLLKDTFNQLYSEHKENFEKTAKKKILLEYEELLKLYSFDRDFEAITRFEFKPLVEFSKLVQKLCTHFIRDDYLNALWTHMDVIYPISSGMETIDEQAKTFRFADGSRAQILYTFDPECRDKYVLKEFFSLVRAHWYAAISNLLKVQITSQDCMFLNSPAYRVPSLVILLDDKGLIRVVTRQFPLITDLQDLQKIKPEHTFFLDQEKNKKNLDPQQWGLFLNEPLFLHTKEINTCKSLFAFDYNSDNSNKSDKGGITFLVEQFKYFNDPDRTKNLFMPTAFLLKSINMQDFWHKIEQNSGKKCKVVSNGIKHACALWIRMIATLDMIIKDLDAPIVVRRDKEDFAAAIQLLEKVMLPKYFNVQIAGKLFDSYEAVEPIIPWNLIEA